MKIKRIEAKNWIGISELGIDLGKINIFSGHKGCGKSSVIEALEKGFTNKNRRSEVIRHGEEEATIFIQTDDNLEIERRIRNGKADYLKIRKPGEAVPNTEAFLRKLINGEVFRPLEFIKKSPEEQAKIILNMLEIPWTMDDIQNWFSEIPNGVNYEAHILQVIKQIEKSYYDQRESVNREIKVLEAQVAGIKNELPANYDGEEWKGHDLGSIYAELTKAQEHNRRLEQSKAIVEGLDARINQIREWLLISQARIRQKWDGKKQEANEFCQFLQSKIDTNQRQIESADERKTQAIASLDNELQAKILEIQREYDRKKEQVARNIDLEREELLSRNAEYTTKLTAKEEEALEYEDRAKLELIQSEEIAAGQEREEKLKAEAQAGELGNTKLIEVEPLKDKAQEVSKMQSYLREWERMVNIIKEKMAPRQELSQTLTARIEKARELPMELLKIAAVPIPGITVDGDGRIRIGQTLISDLSEGEQLELAFKVAKAQAGELKVICLDGINKINESDRLMIEGEMATDDYQYFITSTVDGDFQVEIKEGM